MPCVLHQYATPFDITTVASELTKPPPDPKAKHLVKHNTSVALHIVSYHDIRLQYLCPQFTCLYSCVLLVLLLDSLLTAMFEAGHSSPGCLHKTLEQTWYKPPAMCIASSHRCLLWTDTEQVQPRSIVPKCCNGHPWAESDSLIVV